MSQPPIMPLVSHSPTPPHGPTQTCSLGIPLQNGDPLICNPYIYWQVGGCPSNSTKAATQLVIYEI